MRKIERIYRSKRMEDGEEIYINLKENYKDNKLLIMIIDKYMSEIFEMFKYSHQVRIISGNTDSINKMRNRIRWQIQKESLFESISELKKYLYEILQIEESKWHPSVKNWDKIINEMDCNLTEKILELI